MKRIILSTFFILFSLMSFGQRLFQDAAGESNLFLGTSPFGWLFFNTSDKSASFGYNYYRKAGYTFPQMKSYLVYGGDAKVKIKDGFGNIISKADFKPGISANGNLGLFFDNLKGKGNFLNIYLRPGISYNDYTFIKNAGNIPVIEEVNKLEGALLMNINYQYNGVGKTLNRATGLRVKDPTKHYNVFVGFQTGFKQMNNYSDLNDVEVRYLLFGNTDTAATSVKKGKLGSYKGYNTMPLNIDFAVTPRILGTNVIGFNAYYRTNFVKENNTHNAGVGVYFADPKKPTNIVGGFAWQFNDLGNRLKKEASTIDRSSVFIYIGFAISNC